MQETLVALSALGGLLLALGASWMTLRGLLLFLSWSRRTPAPSAMRELP